MPKREGKASGARGAAMRSRYPRPFFRLGAAGAREWSRAVRDLARQGRLRPNSLFLLQIYCNLTDICANYRAVARSLGADAREADRLPAWRELKKDAAEALRLGAPLEIVRSKPVGTRRPMPKGPHGPGAPGGLVA